MKILHINKFLFPFGGAEKYMFTVSEALIKKGIDVEYWGMKDERNFVKDKWDCFADNVDYHKKSFFYKFRNIFRTVYAHSNRKKIAIILEKFRPDIVHLHNFNFQLTPSILPIIKKYNAKIIYTAHDSQLVCPYHRLYNFQTDSICTKCLESNFYKCVTTKCFDGSLARSFIGATESYLYHSLDYYNKYIDIIISPSKFLGDLLKKRYEKEITVIPNFTSEVKSDCKNTLKKEYILYFGRVSEEKGIFDYYNLFNEMKIKLFIVGTGKSINKIHESEYVHIMGPKYGTDLYQLIKEAKFVFQPSKGYENCPLTVMESFACGTPVIAPNHSGFKELIINGYNGFLFDFSDKELPKKIKGVFDNCTTDLQGNCLKSYRENYSTEIHIEKVLKIYTKILNGN